MPDHNHNFEENVRKTLEELKFQPSDKVWDSVKGTLAPERKKRRGLVLLPLALLLPVAIGFFIWKHQVNTTASEADKNRYEAATGTGKQAEATSEILTENFENTNSPQQAPTATEPAINNNSRQPAGVESPVNSPRQTPENIFSGDNQQPEKPVLNATGKEATTKRDRKPVLNESITDKKPTIQAQTENLRFLRGRLTAETTNLKYAENLTGLFSTFTNPNISLERINGSVNITQYLSPLVIPPTEADATGKWSFGVTASLSHTNLWSGNISNFSYALYDNMLNSPSFSAPQATVVYKPNTAKASFGFSAGVYAEREVSKKLSLSAGLKYSRFTTILNVGERYNRDTVAINYSGRLQPIQGFYRHEENERYSNRINFLEMPLSFHWNFNNSQKLPLFLNTGLSIGYLVSSNALHFDSFNNLYYKNNNQFNKWHGLLNIGISTEIFKNSSVPVSIGPTAGFMFSNLIKNAPDTDKHLYGIGVEAKVKLFD